MNLPRRLEPVINLWKDESAPREFAVHIHERSIEGALVVSSSMENKGPDRRVEFVLPLRFEIPISFRPGNARFFVQGYGSFSGTASFSLDETEPDTLIPALRQVHRNFHVPTGRAPGELTSAMAGSLRLPDGMCLTIGSLDTTRFSTQICTRIDGGNLHVFVRFQLEGMRIPSGASINFPDIWVSQAPCVSALSAYAETLRDRMRVTLPRRVPAGWCSWYHYFTDIDESELLKNVGLAKEYPQIRIFQLDDGYQEGLGEWLVTNPKFPHGLKHTAGKIADAGFIPGLWNAPFIAQKETKVIAKNPDWLLRDERGKLVTAMWNPNWGALRLNYALDASHPGLQEYLRGVYRSLYQSGFRFFKLDFLFAATLPGVRYDKSKTSIEVLREGLQLVRESTGEDAFILGCGCPIEAGIGLVDSMRVGNDVTPFWSNFIDGWIGRGFEMLSTRNCLRNTINRSFFQDVLFQNDPDCLISRNKRNSLSKNEKETLAWVNALSGGPLMISDDLAAVDDESRTLLQSAFRLHDAVTSEKRKFFTPNLLDQRMPGTLVAQGKSDALVGIFNLADQAATLEFNAEALGWQDAKVTDFFTGGKLADDSFSPAGEKPLRIRFHKVLPHAGRVLLFRR